ncbi:MAG: heavy-metal-associated domain-containing protein [Actinomycetota bacterium]|nr:heavy-metal-associated domain-containing protein [Actinomycetota bacterium]
MKERFNVPDVSCGHCRATIEKALESVPGVLGAAVDVDRKVVDVEFDDAVVDRTGVVRAIESSGYVVAG